MAQEVQGKIRTFLASAALAEHRLVKMNSTTQDSIAYPAATEGNLVIGATCERPIANAERGPIRMFNAGGTVRLTAGAAIACNAVVYCVGVVGKIDDAVSGAPIGIALKAATADGDIIEVMVFKQMPNAPTYGVGGVAAGYAIARGENQQAAASDTVVTGLATVVSVNSTPRSRTVKQLFNAASIGDQAGTPAAGSVLLLSYKPTAVNDCTPTAATDFSENIKFNWIAVGTL